MAQMQSIANLARSDEEVSWIGYQQSLLYMIINVRRNGTERGRGPAGQSTGQRVEGHSIETVNCSFQLRSECRTILLANW